MVSVCTSAGRFCTSTSDEFPSVSDSHSWEEAESEAGSSSVGPDGMVSSAIYNWDEVHCSRWETVATDGGWASCIGIIKEAPVDL